MWKMRKQQRYHQGAKTSEGSTGFPSDKGRQKEARSVKKIDLCLQIRSALVTCLYACIHTYGEACGGVYVQFLCQSAGSRIGAVREEDKAHSHRAKKRKCLPSCRPSFLTSALLLLLLLLLLPPSPLCCAWPKRLKNYERGESRTSPLDKLTQQYLTPHASESLHTSTVCTLGGRCLEGRNGGREKEQQRATA